MNVARDKKVTTILLFIDFRKAFDTVDTKLLLLKLFHYGFDNDLIHLIANYFENSCQSTKLGTTTSKSKKVTLCVPQGSVLEPLFFLIFINDLPLFLKEVNCKLFADDTTIYLSGL